MGVSAHAILTLSVSGWLKYIVQSWPSLLNVNKSSHKCSCNPFWIFFTNSHTAYATSHTMAPCRDETHDLAVTIQLPDYYVDAPQAWFRQINSTFAASRIVRPLTMLHWAVSKLGCGVAHLGCGVAQTGCSVAQIGCGVAQFRVRRGSVACRLAVRQARVRISARHPRGGPLPSGRYEDNKSSIQRVVYIKNCMSARLM